MSNGPFSTDVDQLASDEPLSPESVLVMPAELRAQAIARLGSQTRPGPPARVPERVPGIASAPAPVVAGDSFIRTVGVVATGRIAQLGLIFAVVTIFTLAMSLVAQAFR
jgi:hypothetical protein